MISTRIKTRSSVGEKVAVSVMMLSAFLLGASLILALPLEKKAATQRFYFEDNFDDLVQALPEFPIDAIRLNQLKEEDPSLHPGVSELLKSDSTRWTNLFIQDCDQSRFDISSAIKHSGLYSFKSFCDFSTSSTHKVLVTKEGLTLKNGGDFWLDAWFYVTAADDIDFMTLFDIESTETELIPGIKTSPGVRLFVQGDYLGVQSGKWSSFNLTQTNVQFPKNTWINIRLHIFLSDTSRGRVEVWQNNIKLFDAYSKTLPKAGSVYDKVQFGVTAVEGSSNIVTVFIDGIRFSNKFF